MPKTMIYILGSLSTLSAIIIAAILLSEHDNTVNVNNTVTVDTAAERVNVDTLQNIVDWVIHVSGDVVPDRMARDIVKAAFETKYPLLVLSMARAESHFKVFAKSSAGAIGIEQIKPNVWGDSLKAWGIIKNKRDLYDPVLAIKSAAAIINHLYKRYHSIRAALDHYVGHKRSYVKNVLFGLGELYMVVKYSQNNTIKQKTPIKRR